MACVRDTVSLMEQKHITYNDFAKLDIRIGLVKAAEMVPEADKLIKCTIDFGEEIGERTIVSGIALHIAPEEMVGRRLPYIVNLEPRMLRGVESQGMLLALSFGESDFSFLSPEKDVPPGTRLK